MKESELKYFLIVQKEYNIYIIMEYYICFIYFLNFHSKFLFLNKTWWEWCVGNKCLYKNNQVKEKTL